MFDWISGLIRGSGYLGIIFLMFLENVFPPIPSELIMPMAGYLTVKGDLNFWGVILAGTLGSLLGQFPFYFLGRVWGEERLKQWAQRHGHWAAVSPDELDRAKQWFDQYKAGAIFICRVVPAVRSLISIPAGLVKMNLVTFTICTFAGTAIWTAGLTWIGQRLGQNYRQVEHYLNPVSYAIVALILGAYLWRVFRGYRKAKKEKGQT